MYLCVKYETAHKPLKQSSPVDITGIVQHVCHCLQGFLSPVVVVVFVAAQRGEGVVAVAQAGRGVHEAAAVDGGERFRVERVGTARGRWIRVAGY